MCRILLADDSAEVRLWLRELLAAEADLELVGEAENGHQAVEQARALRPDLVLMDISMPGMNGIEATRRIRGADPDVQVLGLSLSQDPIYLRAMRSAGAVGYVFKDDAFDELVPTIRRLCAAHSRRQSDEQTTSVHG